MTASVESATQNYDGSTPVAPVPKIVPPIEDYSGLPPVPEIPIPQRFTEKGVTGVVGKDKGEFMEGRVKKIIEAHPKVREVALNTQYGSEDGRGHDMIVYFTEDSGIDPIHIQVKSSREAIRNYRRRVARRLKKIGSGLTASEWLILDRTIALNGAVRDEREALMQFIEGTAKILKRYDELNRKYTYPDIFGMQPAA
ncbi:MAG: hypothetical protein ABSD69_01590 [Candidatus Levyibacteriota bacterium]|jgi:hypothetical protein